MRRPHTRRNTLPRRATARQVPCGRRATRSRLCWHPHTSWSTGNGSVISCNISTPPPSGRPPAELDFMPAPASRLKPTLNIDFPLPRLDGVPQVRMPPQPSKSAASIAGDAVASGRSTWMGRSLQHAAIGAVGAALPGLVAAPHARCATQHSLPDAAFCGPRPAASRVIQRQSYEHTVRDERPPSGSKGHRARMPPPEAAPTPTVAARRSRWQRPAPMWTRRIGWPPAWGNGRGCRPVALYGDQIDTLTRNSKDECVVATICKRRSH